MNTVDRIRRIQETALVAVSCFVVILALAGCNKRVHITDAFVTTPQPGISAKTMSGILLGQKLLLEKPDESKIIFGLSYAYLQALRENADTNFYVRIDILMQHMLASDPNNPEVPFLRGTILTGKHDFHAAEAFARSIVLSHPEVARYHGLLADVLIETGRYDEARRELQAMADIRPDYAAMTRIAYLREIHGDLAGAREAMEEALRATTGIDENTAWALCEYARLWLASDPGKAETFYTQALETYPDYAPALAGLAKVAMTKNDIVKAETYAQQAIATLPLPEYAILLGDIEAVNGKMQKADVQFTLVRAGYEAIAKTGTNVELEQVKFLLDHDLDTATLVDRARAVYADRPTIYAADTLAWALFNIEQFDEAQTYSEKARTTGSQDPMILFHAGMIAKAKGDTATAKSLFATIQKDSPHFSLMWEPVMKNEMKGL